ncbi:sensor histidine kinase [Oceanobacillus sp. FSL W7-1309]|uniref:sensor histidine kinase n=1 Tax=Oceanobacillus sp. FSL W7-1309 TaxID=2954539 RepID=UPI0030F6D1FC
MLKINKYKLVKTTFYLLHIFLLILIVREYNNAWNILFLPVFFSAITSILTYIIYTHSDKKSSQYLIYFLLAGSLSYFTSLVQSIENYVAIIVFSASFPLSSYYFNKFTTEILFNRRIIRRRQNKAERLNTYLLLAVICIDCFAIIFEGMLSISKIIFVIYFSVNISLPLFKIVYYLLVHKGQRERPFLIWMLVIPLVAFAPFIFLHALPLLIFGEGVNAYITAWTFFVIPIGYTYLMLTRKLLDLQFIFNRTIYYSALALIISSFIILVLFLLYPKLNIIDLVQAFFIILLLNTMFLLAKEQIDYLLRNSLFQDKNNIIQFIERLILELENCLTRQDVNQIAIKEIKKNFNMVDATIIKYNTVTKLIEKEYLIGENNFENIPLEQIIDINGQIIDYENNFGVCLSRHSDSVHYLWIGDHKEHTRISIHDKSWFILFISYLRLTYEIIRMNEDSVNQLIEGEKITSTAISRFLFHFAETERRRLAEDIHDTILQDQIYIYRELDMLTTINNQPEFINLKESFKEIIDKTRRTSTEMIPNTLSIKGLAYSLNELLYQFKEKSQFQLNYEVELTTDDFDHYEKPLLIYRVIEELVNNAIKHSDAGRVSMIIWDTEDQINIDYLDDGKGFEYKEALHQGRIGLNSLVRRINNINGAIEFATDNPKKVHIYITIPR